VGADEDEDEDEMKLNEEWMKNIRHFQFSPQPNTVKLNSEPK
jgi:hypothetical protein